MPDVHIIMNYHIENALSEMDKIQLSRLEYPYDDKTILDPAGCRLLAAFIRSINAGKVLEFGSGFSSLIIARELEKQKDGFLFSVDSSDKYSSTGKEIVDASCNKIKCEFHLSKIVPRFYNKRLLMGYKISKTLLNKFAPFDLVFIDVPNYNKCICESTVYRCFDVLKIGGFIMLGNAACANQSSKKWKYIFGDNAEVHFLEGLGAGIMIIRKLQNASPKYPGFLSSIKESFKTLYYFFCFIFGKYK